MLLSYDAIPFAACNLPDLTETNPANKGKEYCLAFGRGFLWQYAQSGTTDFYRGCSKYAELDAYANGDNAVLSALKKDKSDNGKAAKIDFRPLPLLHKPLMSVEGLLKDHSYEATVTAVDEEARSEEAFYRGKMRGWMEEGEFLAKTAKNTPPTGNPNDVPMDMQDLDLHMELEYKNKEAMAIEQKIAYGMYLADYARQDQQCTRDETVKGVSVMVMARRGPRRLPMHLDPGDCFILPASAEDFPNLQAGAHIERLTLGQVLREIDDDPDTTLSPDEREQLKNLARTRTVSTQSHGGGYSVHGGQVWANGSAGGEPELAGQLDVIRFAFVSTDLEVQKTYTNQFGNKAVREMKADYKGPQEANPGRAKDMQVHRRSVQNWYEGTLILGSEIGYGCRRAYEQLRDEDNPFSCLPFYIVNAPGMMGRTIKSMVERCRIAVDIASRAVVKMQHNEAKYWDLTIKLNRDALVEAAVSGGTGAKVLTNAEVIKELVQENIIVGNEFNDAGEPIGKVLEWIETPLGNAILRHWQTIQNAKAEIADITGINGAISGDDPASRQGEGVTNLAIQGSQNALNHLFVAKHSRFERVAKAIAASVKGSEKRAPLAGSMTVAQRNGTKRTVYVPPAPEIEKREFAFKIEQKPTQEQWAEFYGYMKNFTLGPDPILSPADVADLWTIDNLKKARYLLATRYKRAMSRREQTAATNSENQGKQAQMAAQATGETTDKSEILRHKNKLEEINTTKEWEYKIKQLELGGQASNAATANDAKLAAQQMKEESGLMKHDATLSSQEDQAALERQHQMELAAAQPEPVAA